MLKIIIIIILILSIFNMIFADSYFHRFNTRIPDSINIYKENTSTFFDEFPPTIANCIVGNIAASTVFLAYILIYFHYTSVVLFRNENLNASTLAIYGISIVFSFLVSILYFYSPPKYYKTKEGTTINTQEDIAFRYFAYIFSLIVYTFLGIKYFNPLKD